MIYIAVACLLFALSLTTLGARRVRVPAYYAVLLALFVFSAFRFQVGCDWSGYYFQYISAEYAAEDLIAQFSEPVWWVIIEQIKLADLGYPAMNVFASGVFFGGVHILARRQPDPLAFLVLLFPILIMNMPMSGIRQGAAIGVICVALAAFIDRRPIRFAMLVLLAGGLHTSALVFLTLVPLATGKYSRNRLLVTAVLAVPGLILLAGGIGTGVAVTRYIGGGVDAFGAIFRVGAIFLSAVYFFLFIRVMWQKKYAADYSLATIGAVGMMFTLALLPVSSVIADRFAYYLIPVQAMIFARLPFLPFRRSKWAHVLLPYVGLMIMFVGWTQTSSLFERCYEPYQTVLFGTPKGSILKDGVEP